MPDQTSNEPEPVRHPSLAASYGPGTDVNHTPSALLEVKPTTPRHGYRNLRPVEPYGTGVTA